MVHAYDFYKPKLDSEYPEVDGPVSITAYISAIDASYKAFRNKHTKAKKASGMGREEEECVCTGRSGEQAHAELFGAQFRAIFSRDVETTRR